MNNKAVSIIICCYNSSSIIEETLRHIANQELREVRCEVVLVDNASNDNTCNVATAAWDRMKNNEIELHVVYEPKPGLIYARQRGVNAARFEHLVFCDDDNRLDKDYVYNVFKLFSNNPQVAILGGIGAAEFADEALRPAWFEKFYHSYAVGPQAAKEGSVRSVYGAGMAIRKSVLEQVLNNNPIFLLGRKQNELSSGEDTEICYRITLAGYQILYSPQLSFKHLLTSKRLTWDYLKKLHVGLAKSNVVLNLYEKAIDSNSAALSYGYWLKKSLYYWCIYFKYWPKHYAAYKKADSTIEELHSLMWKNIAIGYFKYNFATLAIYRKIAAQKAINKTVPDYNEI